MQIAAAWRCMTAHGRAPHCMALRTAHLMALHALQPLGGDPPLQPIVPTTSGICHPALHGLLPPLHACAHAPARTPPLAAAGPRTEQTQRRSPRPAPRRAAALHAARPRALYVRSGAGTRSARRRRACGISAKLPLPLSSPLLGTPPRHTPHDPIHPRRTPRWPGGNEPRCFLFRPLPRLGSALAPPDRLPPILSTKLCVALDAPTACLRLRCGAGGQAPAARKRTCHSPHHRQPASVGGLRRVWRALREP